jgi:hypothetical protein
LFVIEGKSKGTNFSHTNHYLPQLFFKLFSRKLKAKFLFHDNQTDAKIEPIFDPIYAKISRNADG